MGRRLEGPPRPEFGFESLRDLPDLDLEALKDAGLLLDGSPNDDRAGDGAMADDGAATLNVPALQPRERTQTAGR